MVKRKQTGTPAVQETTRGASNAEKLRLRAIWMYYIEQKTQSEIADILNIGRVTVVRLLADARARNEVHISVNSKLASVIQLERALESSLGLQKAVVAPLSEANADPVPTISAALGDYLSTTVHSDMKIGVGWGRTLYSSLQFIRGQTLENFQVISLLGGIIKARRFNPAEFAWQFAEIFQGEGFLVPAPAIVDSPETRRSLIEKCGIDSIFEMALHLDAVLLSVGGVTSATTSYRVGYLTEEDHDTLVKAGAIGDILFQFFNKDGQIVDHGINQRIMSVALDVLRQVPVRIMASGGADKVDALLSVKRLIEPTVLVTDEQTAMQMLTRLGISV